MKVSNIKFFFDLLTEEVGNTYVDTKIPFEVDINDKTCSGVSLIHTTGIDQYLHIKYFSHNLTEEERESLTLLLDDHIRLLEVAM